MFVFAIGLVSQMLFLPGLLYNGYFQSGRKGSFRHQFTGLSVLQELVCIITLNESHSNNIYSNQILHL